MAIRKPTPANGAIDDDKLDQMLDDSFPASDPPSFTPVARIGKPPEDEIGDFPGDDESHSRLTKLAVGAVAVGTAIFFIVRALRGRNQKRRVLGVTIPDSANAIVQPLLDRAPSGKEAVALATEKLRRAA